MTFSVAYPTRHTDTFAATGFVHAGVLLAMTELAYATFESHCGIAKPVNVVAVQRTTHATYAAPLPWQDGATIEVVTTNADARGFTQEFTVRSTTTGATAATFIHHWAWLDTTTGRRVDIPGDVQERLLAG